jgi:hypothetical protein
MAGELHSSSWESKTGFLIRKMMPELPPEMGVHENHAENVLQFQPSKKEFCVICSF